MTETTFKPMLTARKLSLGEAMKRPMLAGTVTDVNRLRFPLLASPKLDGIRASCVNGRLVTRKMKLVPNRYVQSLFGRVGYTGLDGELLVGPTFQSTTSGIMSEDGEPDVTWWIFDRWTAADRPFRERFDSILRVSSPRIEVVPHITVTGVKDLLRFEKTCLTEGYEGVMLRDPDGPYKQGRSTEREGWLLKLKRFKDSEAVIVAVEEEMENRNVAKQDERGYTKRSHRRSGMRPKGTLGSLIVRDVKTGIEFGVGSGFTAQQRKEFWESYLLHHRALVGKVIRYRFQEVGVKDKPRFPTFTGFRDRRDM